MLSRCSANGHNYAASTIASPQPGAGERFVQANLGKTQEEAMEIAQKTLKFLGLNGFEDRITYKLSGGEKKLISLATVLAMEPEVLLLDEPTANIDSKGQAEFFSLLETLNSEIAILVVSHDLLAISRYVKAVACVNKRLHFHNQAEITLDMLEIMYPCTAEDVCPVELVAHGLPHRVLQNHKR